MLAIAWRRCDDTAFVVTIAGLNLALFSPARRDGPGDQGVTPAAKWTAMRSSTWGWCSSAPWPPVPSVALWLRGYPDNREEFYLLLYSSPPPVVWCWQAPVISRRSSSGSRC